MDEIKFDKVNTPLTHGKIQQNIPQAATDAKEEGVVVTNHLSQLVGLLGTEDHMPDESARVADMKRRIQSNDYSVDIGALSEKLLNSGVLRTSGV